MDIEKNKQLAARLTEFDIQGYTFFEAKQLLLNEGYTDDEIHLAALNNPFDGKKNEPRKKTDQQVFMEQHPEIAEKVANAVRVSEKEAGETIQARGVGQYTTLGVGLAGHKWVYLLLNAILILDNKPRKNVQWKILWCVFELSIANFISGFFLLINFPVYLIVSTILILLWFIRTIRTFK